MDTSQERKERATPRKRQKARQRGHTARSPELTSAAVLLAGLLALRWTGPAAWDSLQTLARSTLGALPAREWAVADFQQAFSAWAWLGLGLVLPLLATVMLAGAATSVAQVGFLVSLDPVAPSLSRLDPVAGLRRMFSRRAGVELIKALAKVLVVGYVTYLAVAGEAARLPDLVGMEPRAALPVLGVIAQRVAWRAGLALLVMGVLDLAYQRWEYEQSLRMTRQEVKEEFKETEGHPHVRARIRERQRQLATRRMMAAVPRADVVVTNPVHLAVALQYDPAVADAPRVVAKGQGHLAERIRRLAAEHQVPLVQNPPLAQALYRLCEVGRVIPAELYRAVAEVLAFVYRLTGRLPRQVAPPGQSPAAGR